MIKKKNKVGIKIMPIIFNAKSVNMAKFTTPVTADIGTTDDRRTDLKLSLYLEGWDVAVPSVLMDAPN